MRSISISIFLLIMACLPAVGAGTARGLFVGISDYQLVKDIPYCAADAPKVAAVFANLSGHLRIDTVHATVLVDSMATRARLIEDLESHARLSKRDDLFVFYYSGHGEGFNEPDVAPYDEKDDRDETLIPWESDATHEMGISDDQLRVILAGFSCPVMMIIDACYSGGFVPDLAGDSRLIIAASSESRKSRVSYAHRISGSLTHALVLAARGAADRNRNGVITINEMTKFLRTEVPLHCPKCGRRNQPASTKCFYDSKALMGPAAGPIIGGRIPVAIFTRGIGVARPRRCVTNSERRRCGENPEGCVCAVKGECGESKCMALGRTVIERCGTSADEAVCHANQMICPCSVLGNCGMENCHPEKKPGCATAEEQAQCGEDPERCVCPQYGNCEMERCNRGHSSTSQH